MPSKKAWIAILSVVIIAVVISTLYTTDNLPLGSVAPPPTSVDIARCVKKADNVVLAGDMKKIFEGGEASEKTQEIFVDKNPGTYTNEGFYRFEFLEPRMVSISLPFSKDIKVKSGQDLRTLPVNAPLSLMEVDYVRGSGGTILFKSGKKMLISNNTKQIINDKSDRIQSIALRTGERVTVFLNNVCRKSRYVTFTEDTDASKFNVCAYASALFTTFTIE
jgi:hypothetical protein